MKKSPKSKNKEAAPKVDPYLEGLMAKLLDRLVGLERKMDTVIAQTSARPSAGGEAPKAFQNHAPQNGQPGHEPRRKERTLYEAICADCRKVCEVPFKPSEGRAVYCKECFALRRSGGAGRPDAAPRPAAVPAVPRPAEKPAFQAPAAPVRATPAKAKKSAPATKAKKKK